MRIVLDLQGAQTASRFRGIGRYTLSLAKAIVANSAGHDVLIALSGLFPETIEPIRAAFDPILPQDNIRIWFAPSQVAVVTGDALRRQIAEPIREAFLANLQPDIVHVSSLFEGFGDDAVTSIGVFAPLPTAITLYDLIPLTLTVPHPAFAEYYARKLEFFRRADLWLGISDYSCQEAISRLHLDADKVVNIGGAADERFKPIDLSEFERSKITQAYGLEKPFVCWVGTPGEGRKNVAGVMQAFARLPPKLRASLQLLIIGKMHPGEAEALERTACGFGLEGIKSFLRDTSATMTLLGSTVFAAPLCFQASMKDSVSRPWRRCSAEPRSSPQTRQAYLRLSVRRRPCLILTLLKILRTNWNGFSAMTDSAPTSSLGIFSRLAAFPGTKAPGEQLQLLSVFIPHARGRSRQLGGTTAI